jgi:hypothetical protein
MADSTDQLQQLTLGCIMRRCAQESDLFFRRQPHDSRFCFEIWRRAILERSQYAWELIYTQYRPLVSSWITRHPNFCTSGEEVEYFVNCAFEKFWSALTPDKFLLFPDLKALLRYLQMCVHSAIVDHVRSNGHITLSLCPEVCTDAGIHEAPGAAADLHDIVQRHEFWSWLKSRLHSDKERQVVYGSFFLALKPRELHQQFHDLFRDVAEVHRVKENVLARLRRDPELRRFFGDDAGKPVDSSFSE